MGASWEGNTGQVIPASYRKKTPMCTIRSNVQIPSSDPGSGIGVGLNHRGEEGAAAAPHVAEVGVGTR
jgi:hypothetical protein